MDKLYYKEYYEMERKHWFFLARGKILMNHLETILREKGTCKILNVGAATGQTSKLLEQFGEVKSLEYDKDCCDFTREELGIEIIHGTVLDLPYEDNSFDLVCAFDVIEHVEDDKLAVEEMQRVCSDKGFVCVTVPAFQFMWSEHDEINHHFRRYTKKPLLKLFGNQDNFVFHSYFNFWLFFPIAAYRVLTTKIFKKKKKKEDSTGSDLQAFGKNKFIEKVLYKMFSSESFFIKRKIKLPVGVSVMATWQKR